MTSFIYTWNSAFLSVPTDVEAENLGPQRIRDTKGAVGERLAVNHSLNGDANDGLHTVVQMLTQTSDPTAAAGMAALYSKIVNSNNELFFEDSSGHVVQLSNAGSINTPPFVPSGTNMLFVQASVPTGWTLNTTLNDCLIRVNNAIGGATGGSWALSGVTIGGTALTLSQLPNVTFPQDVLCFVGAGGNSDVTGGSTFLGQNISLGGGGQAHAHGFSNDSSWRPAYVDAIIGVKN